MELDKVLKELEKIKDLNEKIKFLEKLIVTEKDVKLKTALKELVERLKKSDKKEEPKKPARLEDMVIRSGILGPESTVRLSDAEYMTQFGRVPTMAPSLAAMTTPPNDKLKEDYVQNKDYVEMPGLQQQLQPGEYIRNDNPEYIARHRAEQTLGFRPVEEQRTEVNPQRQGLNDPEYKREESVKDVIREKELNREDYLREKRKKDLRMMR